MREILKAYVNCLNFGGKASRKEYDVFLLYFVLTSISFFYACAKIFSDVFVEYSFLIFLLWSVVLLLPMISLLCRRIKDSNVQVEGCLWFINPVMFVFLLTRMIFAPSIDAKESAFIKFMGLMAGELAANDGIASDTSRNAMISAFHAMHFSHEKLSLCKKYFNEGMDPKNNIFETAGLFLTEFDEKEIRVLMFKTLCFISASDGWITSEKLSILRELPELFDISSAYFYTFCREAHIDPNSDKSQKIQFGQNERNYQKRESSYQETEQGPYEIIGASSTMSNDELKKAYLKKVRENHPDVLRSKGVPEEILRLYTDEMAKINNAWEEIKKMRGIS